MTQCATLAHPWSSDSSCNIHNALYFVKYPSRAAQNSPEERRRPAGRGLKTLAVVCNRPKREKVRAVCPYLLFYFKIKSKPLCSFYDIHCGRNRSHLESLSLLVELCSIGNIMLVTPFFTFVLIERAINFLLYKGKVTVRNKFIVLFYSYTAHFRCVV